MLNCTMSSTRFGRQRDFMKIIGCRQNPSAHLYYSSSENLSSLGQAIGREHTVYGEQRNRIRLLGSWYELLKRE